MIAKRVTGTPIVAVYLWARVGAVCEPAELNGISHFFEHMFFKGTDAFGMGEMDRAIKAMGGYNNAFTGLEYTAYYVVVPSEHFASAFEMLFDATVHSRFDLAEIDKERQVINEEIRRSEHNPQSKLQIEFMSAMFRDNPYGRPVLGTEASLARIGREDFLSFLRHFYGPDNMTAVVVGDVEEDGAIEAVAGMTREWVEAGAGHPGWPGVRFPNQPDGRERVVERDVNVGYWVLGFPTRGRSRMEDVYALDVATTILGSGLSSRLHRGLVEEMKIATAVGAWVWPFAEAGILGFDAKFEPVHHQGVQEAVLEEVEKMGREPVRQDELDKAKRMLTSDFAYGNETNSNIAATLGRYQTVSSLEEGLRYVDKIRKVSAEDVLQAMRTYGRRGFCTVAYLKPR